MKGKKFYQSKLTDLVFDLNKASWEHGYYGTKVSELKRNKALEKLLACVEAADQLMWVAGRPKR